MPLPRTSTAGGEHQSHVPCWGLVPAPWIDSLEAASCHGAEPSAHTAPSGSSTQGFPANTPGLLQPQGNSSLSAPFPTRVALPKPVLHKQQHSPCSKHLCARQLLRVPQRGAHRELRPHPCAPTPEPGSGHSSPEPRLAGYQARLRGGIIYLVNF